MMNLTNLSPPCMMMTHSNFIRQLHNSYHQPLCIFLNNLCLLTNIHQFPIHHDSLMKRKSGSSLTSNRSLKMYLNYTFCCKSNHKGGNANNAS
jgi:hypothetical protein